MVVEAMSSRMNSALRLTNLFLCSVLLVLSVGARISWAVPIKWEVGTDPKTGASIYAAGKSGWAQPSNINLYLVDPVAPGHVDVGLGVSRWNSVINSKNLGVTIQTGPPPAGATNVMQVKFVDRSTLKNPANDAEAEPAGGFERDPNTGGWRATPIEGGTIYIANDAVSKGSEYLQNLAMHEFGHILGLDDESTANGSPHNVMDPKVPLSGQMTFSARDLAELNTQYGPAAQAAVQTLVQPGPVSGTFSYLYEVSWLAGAEIPLFEIQVAPGAQLFDLVTSGWDFVDLRAPTCCEQFDLLQAHEGDILPPVPSTLATVAFQNAEQALGSDPGYQTASLGFTSDSPPGDVLAFASGSDVFSSTGPVSVPEPDTFGILDFCLVCLGLVTCKWSANQQRKSCRPPSSQPCSHGSRRRLRAAASTSSIDCAACHRDH